MQYRNMGRTGVKVSDLCLGTMTFGEADENSFMYGVGCDESTSFSIMSRATDAGVNFFDTADVYGQDGLTERIVGKWFAQDKRRDEIVLATKCRFRMGEGPNSIGASRYRIMQAVEASLKRLQTDRIDLYQIHMQDIDTPEDETLRALDDLVRSGKVLYIGASNYAAYRLLDALWISKTRNLERFATYQVQYNLMERELEREHVPICMNEGVGVLPWSPLAGGFLTGKFNRGDGPTTGTRMERWKQAFDRYDNDRGWGVIEALRAVATELDATPSQVSLAWLRQKPWVTSVIFGARSLEQLDDNLKAGALEIPETLMQRLDEASAFEVGYPYNFITRVQDWW
jgi:aryl-alcohol dehydrogenase-like predicted oxidoreductase